MAVNKTVGSITVDVGKVIDKEIERIEANLRLLYMAKGYRAAEQNKRTTRPLFTTSEQLEGLGE